MAPTRVYIAGAGLQVGNNQGRVWCGGGGGGGAGWVWSGVGFKLMWTGRV